MRLNTISTTWITILALAALLMSGFASSSTMMNNAMQHGGPTTSFNCPSLQKIPTHHKMMMSDSTDMKGQCEVVTDMVHDCCDSTCATTVAIFVTPHVLVAASTSLALFTPPLSGEVVHQTQSLYRPPIA